MKNKPYIILAICIITLSINLDIIFNSKVELQKDLPDMKQEINSDNQVIVDKVIEEIPQEEQPKEIIYNVTFEVQEGGYNIYLNEGYGYRYGPSFIKYDDGTMDAWFASPGENGEWDWIRYKHYNGKTWGKEEVVLTPSDFGLDHYSVCDPGVIFFDDYYYLAYTSTTDLDGYNNQLFVARSKNPNGPFEKWNGDGWGGDPEPFIEYADDPKCWGAGEASFVIYDDDLYIYYSWINPDGDVTKLAKADLCEDWPKTIRFKGNCYYKQNAQDSCDVVYIDELDKFVAFSTMYRFTENSSIAIFTSDNGSDFELSDIVNDDIRRYCHNMGISKNPDGHIHLDDDLFIGYAYGPSWGRWSTMFQNIKLKLFEVEE